MLKYSVCVSLQISGSIPGCLLEAPWLREIYLAGNSLSGSFPSVPKASPLTTISASDQASHPFPTSLSLYYLTFFIDDAVAATQSSQNG